MCPASANGYNALSGRGGPSRPLARLRGPHLAQPESRALPQAHLQTLNDPQFEAKFWDVIGLYLDPPEKSLVLCCDEETRCQALERTQPSLPLGPGHIRIETHDNIRHGMITLFAALNYLDGKLIYRTEWKHPHVEWLRILKQLEREAPKDVDIHLIADNYATHKRDKVRRGWRGTLCSTCIAPLPRVPG